jgi:hypothetical protein
LSEYPKSNPNYPEMQKRMNAQHNCFKVFFPITDIATYRLNLPRTNSSEMHNKVGR